ncbi:XXYS1_4_G0014060.mRNA.1.CDS.1 [Saccharomyces cerevisiae]|nr:EM14S01-3B_G0011410.mRNA.1.CDS.1 [Saccharomyces cerevisiae]CAD6644307.1 XXYS1_4_G0014060.mRNA.1.CDS.1 [Saccharomyces cerevisiae]CAI4738137.1 CEI_1a_G0045820.mRNA.1.CDS.1 [Saccharomyces cerevisiae]CAI4741938.1 AMH_1a_G0045920.mRNA.1.CDS.1 [Saccharomyces cerevisiae]CAI6862145.1 AMH_1a_G0045920.mRNA.1.CDS.1 [Saccharomyces cerevisiae]
MSRSNSIYTEDIEMYPTHNEKHLTREYTKPDGQTKSEKLNFEGAYINSHGTLSKTTTREIEGDLDSETSSHSSDDKVDTNQQITAETKAPYTLLSYGQKWGMVAILTMCGFWSSLGSPIYYPALRQLEKQFNVDENMVNVTVVVYLLFQGVSPTVSGGLADCFGRRPIILAGMLIYVIASIGLACAPSYGVIIFLRCIQSIGISPTIAISSGVVGDFTLKHERGTFVGATSGFVLLGQCFGSLIGAVLTARWDWRAIFWFLTIGCGSCFLIAFLILPETKRTIAGNLSIKPKRFINRAPIFLLGPVRRRFKYDNPDYETLDPTIPKLDLSSAGKILVLPEIILSLFPSGLLFAMWTLMLSSISSGLSVAPYNYHLVIIGVCYLPGGIGGLMGSFFTGRIIDMYFKRKIKKFEQDKANGLIPQDAEINMFKVRLVCLLPQNFLAVVAYLLFGWSIDKGWRIESILITSFVCSYCAMSTLSTSTTLLVDLYPTKSSTASSCFNFVRCSLSTIFMGCFAKMKAAMTVGGTFTFLCALVFFFNFLMFIPMKYGMKWREDRLLKQQR